MEEEEEEENRYSHDALGTNQEFLTEGDYADNPLNTYPSSADTNEQNFTPTTETANCDQDSDSIPMENDAYQERQFWIQYQLHSNSPAWAATSTGTSTGTGTGTGTGTIPQFPSITNSIPGLRTSSGRHPVVVQAKCSFCKELGHRVPTCPSLSCNHCAIMGHVGKDCPKKKGNKSGRKGSAVLLL